MASDGEDLDDLEALRQAALASVKNRAKTELLQLESSPSSIKADDDEDLSALREAALRSTKAHTTVIFKDKLVADPNPHSNPPPPPHRNRRHQRHPRHSRQRHPYDKTQRNGNWRKYHYSQNRANNLIVVPLALQGENSKRAGYKLRKGQELGSNLKLPENKSLLLSQDKLAEVQPSASETISSAADRNLKKRKDGKFSRYDDSESEEDSASDSDLLSLSSDSPLKDTCSESEQTVSNQLDTRIVKRDESKDIVIQKAVSDNSEFEATGDSLEIQDKVSSDSLLEDFDEPLLDIQENGEIDDTTNAVMNTSDKQVTDDAFSVDLLPSESLDRESESADKEVLEARKKKFESTEEIKGSDLKKTISLKGIVPKSRKRHRQQQHHHRSQREDKLSHSSHKEELHSRDLKERNCDEVEDLHLKTSRSKNYQRQHNKYSSGSSRSSEDSCHSGSFSDTASQPIRLKDHPYYNVETGTSTSNRFSQPMSSYGENQRRVVQERSPHRSASKPARYDLSDLSDSGEDNENSLFKKRSLSSVVRTSPNPKSQKARKVLDSDQHGNCPKEHCSSDLKAKHSILPRGWTALMESRTKNWLTSDKDFDYLSNCKNMELDEQLDKSPQINFTFENDEVHPAKKVDDRLSVHQRLGFTSKAKLEIPEKSTGKHQEKSRENRKNKSSDPSKETELDQKILRIQEMNAAILKRQAEVKKDKERYG